MSIRDLADDQNGHGEEGERRRKERVRVEELDARVGASVPKIGKLKFVEFSVGYYGK